MRRIGFMMFWRTVNEILKGRGLPEMLYGEAHRYWVDTQWEVAA